MAHSAQLMCQQSALFPLMTEPRRRSPMTPWILLSAAGWTLPWGGATTQQQRLEASRLNFERLAAQPGSQILRVYARPNKSCQAGRDASGSLQPGAAKRGQREAVDPRPWHLVGRVATIGTANVDAAVHAQRPLLEAEARLQKPLRPHRTLVLAWAPGDSATGDVSLGSFLCPRCNAQSSASASECWKAATRITTLTLALTPTPTLTLTLTLTHITRLP